MKAHAHQQVIATMCLLMGFIAWSDAHAGSAIRFATLSGDLTLPVQPTHCHIVSAPIFMLHAAKVTTQHSFSMQHAIINCSQGVNYEVGSEIAWNIYAIDNNANAISVAILNPNTNLNIADAPIHATGNGADQSIPLRIKLESQPHNAAIEPSTNDRTEKGSIPITITY